MRLRAWLLVAALTATANAQPDTRDHRHPPPPPPPSGHDHRGDAMEPTEAPPPPKEEAQQARAGFVWIKGRWDWKAGKWDWMPGHWERERAGKQWREDRWENEGGHWKLVAGDWVDAGAAGVPPPVAVPPPAGDAPNAAPPPDRDEPQQPRAGFVWAPGQWDWKAGKYEWTPGHWEREQANRHWRPSRWEQQGGRWTQVAGGWEDQGAAGAPMPPPGPEHEHRHDWRVERPTVSSYWPAKGKPGTKIVIRGVHFPEDAKVVFAGKPVMAAKVKADMIEFMVPADATSGDIELDRGHGRPLAVGPFEVAAGWDPAAEQKKLDDERRKHAEDEWREEQSKMAKDKAAREAEWQKREQEMDSTREQRREQRAQEIRAKWDAAFLADADTQDELTMHAQRVAELERMKDIAQVNGDQKLGVRVDVATQKENDRHEQRMKALHDSFKPGGAK